MHDLICVCVLTYYTGFNTILEHFHHLKKQSDILYLSLPCLPAALSPGQSLSTLCLPEFLNPRKWGHVSRGPVWEIPWLGPVFSASSMSRYATVCQSFFIYSHFYCVTISFINSIVTRTFGVFPLLHSSWEMLLETSTTMFCVCGLLPQCYF